MANGAQELCFQPEIRDRLRKLNEEAGDNPPNVNRAWDLIKVQMPAPRSRVREVLKEDEFAGRSEAIRVRASRHRRNDQDLSFCAPVQRGAWPHIHVFVP
jgi:hypothetical protein